MIRQRMSRFAAWCGRSSCRLRVIAAVQAPLAMQAILTHRAAAVTPRSPPPACARRTHVARWAPKKFLGSWEPRIPEATSSAQRARPGRGLAGSRRGRRADMTARALAPEGPPEGTESTNAGGRHKSVSRLGPSRTVPWNVPASTWCLPPTSHHEPRRQTKAPLQMCYFPRGFCVLPSSRDPCSAT